jgi:hypothetical protein
MNTPRSEQEEAIYRIEWLIAHHAPTEWRIVTVDEVAEVKRELAAVTAERDALLRGEYICKKCGIRKDGEGAKGDF